MKLHYELEKADVLAAWSLSARCATQLAASPVLDVLANIAIWLCIGIGLMVAVADIQASRGLLASSTFLVLALGSGAALLGISFSYYRRRKVRRAVLSTLQFPVPHTVTLTDAGMLFESRLGTLTIPWSSVSRVYNDTPLHVGILLNSFTALVVPARAFSSLDERMGFVSRCSSMAGS